MTAVANAESLGGFGREHLPYGALQLPGEDSPRLAVRYGDVALDLAESSRLGRFAGVVDEEVLTAPNLNRLLAQPPEVWQSVRERVVRLVDQGLDSQPTIALADARTCLPFEVADYVDFYSSEEHATNLSRMFRPDAAQLPAAWRTLPIGYHGRAGTVQVGGCPVRRPVGHRRTGDDAVTFEASTELDIELELGFVTGGAPSTPLDQTQAERLIFGVVLVNDWSARDLQRFEYVPLGPFLGKSFTTSVSAWVTPLEALSRARVPAVAQNPEPLGGLAVEDRWALDLELEVLLRPAGSTRHHLVSRTGSKGLYWTFTQQLVHAASNGATIRPGDLFATGTISGTGDGAQGSLIELTWNRERPMVVDGRRRTFLEDGDSVILRARTSDGLVALGEVEGTVEAAPSPTATTTRQSSEGAV